MKPVSENFRQAIQRLEEVLAVEKNAKTGDSAIERFEICCDVAWETIKVFAHTQGVECDSPRACFKEAFRLGLIGQRSANCARERE